MCVHNRVFSFGKYWALNPFADFLSDLFRKPWSNSAPSTTGAQRRNHHDALLRPSCVCEVEKTLNTGARTLEIVFYTLR